MLIGAGRTFVVWGLVHGFYRGTHALLRKFPLTRWSVTFNRLVTFALVCAAFVIFRSPGLQVAGQILSSMIGLNGLDSAAQLDVLQIRIRPRAWQGIATGIGAAVAIMTISQPHPFIYFQF